MQYMFPLYWILLFLLFTPIGINAQFSKNWSSWEELYKDHDITVELRVYTPKPNSCINKNKKFKFKYRVSGKYKNTKTYLNWMISYVDCNGRRYYQQNSLALWKNNFHDISGGISIPVPDKQFTGERIDKNFYDVQISSSQQEGSGLLAPLKSEAPQNIKGLEKIFVGETVELKVEGGVLGEDAKWVWYIGECGKRKIKEGKNVKLNIERKTTVFVRAEGKNNKTKCVQKTIEVDPRSGDPNSISGRTSICTGDNVTLSVKGGTLGVKAQWVWYSDDCGVNKIGAGSTISIQPLKTNRYYVRAEGEFNVTNCASVSVNVNSPVKPPGKIQVIGHTSICQGESSTLSVKGSSNINAYKWYAESCGGKLVGSGLSINVKPYQTTTYFVRAEGACNETICLSKKIIVSNSSRLPSSIIETSRKGKKSLKINKDARLAPDAEWKWYKGNCGNGSSIGNGTFVKIKDRRKPTTYYVRAEGNCPSINCTRISINPVGNIKKKFQNFNTIHFGFAIGLEYNNIQDISTYSSFDIDELEGMGIRGEVFFHPIMKDFFSMGILSSISVGTSLYIFSGGVVSNTSPTQTDKYFYTHANIGAEVALGFSSLKILTVINKEIQYNDLDRTIGNSTITFDNELNRDYIGIGLRLGSYRSRRNVDFLYLLYRNNKNNFSEFEDTFSSLETRLSGFQISWKKFNGITLRTNIYLPITHQQLMKSNSNNDNVSFYSSLVINLNRFY